MSTNSYTHNFLHKSYKWYRKLAFRLITQAILNSHKVYQKVSEKNNATFCDFLRDIITLVIQPVIPAVDPMIRFDETYSRLTGRHFPDVKKPVPGAKDQQPTKIFAKLVLRSQDFISKIASKYTIRN